MRRVLALGLLLGCTALAAPAAAVEDRYGPPRKAAAPAPGAPMTSAASYAGPMLGWSGKRAAAPEPPPQALAARPDPLPLAASFRAPSAPEPRPAAEIAARPAPPQPAPSLYDAPPAPRIASVPPAPEAPRAQLAPSLPEPPAPPRLAAIAPPAASGGAAPSRLYSLHREYGMAPDAAPPTPARSSYVLIGPPDETAAETDADDESPPARRRNPDARPF